MLACCDIYVAVPQNLRYIVQRGSLFQHICCKRGSQCVNTGMALGSKIYPCQAHIFPDFRVEIVMMIKWLKGCVVTKKNSTFFR